MVPLLPQFTGLPRSGKSQGKTKIFQGQGKVREFCKKSGKISVLVKVSEKSGNFVFRLAQGFVKIMKTFSFRKLLKLWSTEETETNVKVDLPVAYLVSRLMQGQ